MHLAYSPRSVVNPPSKVPYGCDSALPVSRYVHRAVRTREAAHSTVKARVVYFVAFRAGKGEISISLSNGSAACVSFLSLSYLVMERCRTCVPGACSIWSEPSGLSPPAQENLTKCYVGRLAHTKNKERRRRPLAFNHLESHIGLSPISRLSRTQ